MEQNKRTPTTHGLSAGAEAKDYDDVVVSYDKDTNNNSDSQRFARVADRYFQFIATPDGDYMWIARDKAELKADGVVLAQIPRYYGFTVEHNFTGHYRNEINGWLNLSNALVWQAKEGDFPTIEKLFTHIFGEQLQLGYDRYSLLARKPSQLQPILVVTSKKQGTGKSTLLYFDSCLFGCNAVILNVSQYSQQFNGLYASKLLIGIDETVISETFVKERLKQDSTAKTIQLRKMHQEHSTLPFFGKFTLCTNKETDFATLEEEDLRFWVRKVGRIADFDPNFEKKIKEEIPAFLHFLLNRELSVPQPLSRQWFSPEQLKTDALDKVLANSRSACLKDILIWADDTMASSGIKGFGITVSDLYTELGGKYTRNEIGKALKDELKLDNKHRQYVNRSGCYGVGRAYQFGEMVTEGKHLTSPF